MDNTWPKFYKLFKNVHCVKTVKIRSFFWSVFEHLSHNGLCTASVQDILYSWYQPFIAPLWHKKDKIPANEFYSFVESFLACNLQINWHMIWGLSFYSCSTALSKRKHKHIILILLLACILLTKSFLENVKRTALLRHESISFVKEYQLLTNLITWDCYFLHIFFWKI